MHSLKLALVCALLFVPEPVPAWKADTVRLWARALGDDLWKLSEALTKSDQIRTKYKQMNASVKKKDGNQILESSLRSVSTMLTRKINAVKCIHATAERLAKEFTPKNKTTDGVYCSAKYSKFSYPPGEAPDPNPDVFQPKYVENKTDVYMNVSLEKDSHFYNISVNTDTSCVHVPTNIYDGENNTLNAIMWSKGLNDIFIKNYKSDPSLSWQYFGSSTGILRFYPGMPWNVRYTDTYDCRVKSWYIEAATCSKDMIILFDVSGSMTGFKNYVARRTLQSILETLSNNDYVNVYTFKNQTELVVDCFVDLVQATPENVKTLIVTLTPTNNGKNHKKPLEGYANLTNAYIKAFETLKKRRVVSKCDVSSTQGCNQLVMVITDYVPGNLTEVFENYNREMLGNNTYIPVRVFTYLIGKEVTNVREIQWMACLNRGYFVHIHSVEEVQQQVLKYINVIARPMILENKEPPPTWTHANIDNTRTSDWNVSGDLEKPDEDKLVTSVAIPAFDYKYNKEHNNAFLLGVAGTDVPIDSIAKLAQPHQLGVNGYSFIVSNNGYLLLHPLLIATINSVLQTNYNSVDFVEVEQVDDGKGSRVLGEKIMELRQKLANGTDGEMQRVEVLYHYDNMRRIARVKHDYFFNRLEGTPFSMGISLPKGYGDTELMLKDNPLEAKQGKELTGINVTDYFRFSYRVHPDWVYCKYHYLEGHEYENPEMEAWKFFVGLSNNEIDITKQQYTQDNKTEKFSVETHCGITPLDNNDYYCNEDLVKQLVFDAKLSTPYFEEWIATDEEKQLSEMYNVSVRFIATSSGLTRWHYIFDEDKNEKVDEHGTRRKNFPGDVFGDQYHNAIEETWYKAAVLQHMINKESLVIATPLPILDDIIKEQPSVMNEDGDITITASYAIFYKDGNSSTPASVVGFQYSYMKFYENFLRITNVTLEPDDPNCNSSNYECYVIDSSGYIVLSNDKDEVGQFFGRMDSGLRKYVLQSLLDLGIFDHVEVFNYQALCPVSMIVEKNHSWSIKTPFSFAFNFLSWFLTEALFLLTNVHNWKEYAYAAVLEDADYYDHISKDGWHTEAPPTTPPPLAPNETITAKEKDDDLFSCDHSVQLYILNQSYFLEAAGASPTVSKDEAGECYPAYWASFIPKTNTLLVVIKKDTNYYDDCPVPRDTKPTPTKESTDSRDPCHKLDLSRLFRRRLEGCYTYHEDEQNIKECGIASVARCDRVVLVLAACLLIVSKMTFL